MEDNPIIDALKTVLKIILVIAVLAIIIWGISQLINKGEPTNPEEPPIEEPEEPTDPEAVDVQVVIADLDPTNQPTPSENAFSKTGVIIADQEIEIFPQVNGFVEAEDDLDVISIDLYKDGNDELFKKIAEMHGLSRVTPTIFIGDTVIQGYADADTTGQLIYQLRDRSGQPVIESVEEYIDFEGLKEAGDYMDSVCDPTGVEPCEIDVSLFYDFKVPIIGKVNLEKWSLPTMSMVLGFIDGFNPCAMWVLVTFLIVLLQIGDKKKMLQIAGLFIVAEAIMYYLILNVWLGVWDFVGLDNIITSIVGTVAIGGGLFFLWEWKTSDGTCKVTNLKQRQKTTSRIKKIADMKMGVAAVIAIIGLALSVNIIEFACSIGIPQAYTKILDLNGLSMLQTQVYTLLYILMYMVDDLIVFGLAFYAVDKMHLTTKYSKLCNLIGGILMLVLGALLLFAPELLMF